MPTRCDGAPTAPRGGVRLLIDPVFGSFFFGKVLAILGTWVHNITAAIVVFDLTGSATYVGAVSMAQFGPQLLLTAWAGSLADSHSRRAQLILGRVITASGSGGLAIWLALSSFGSLVDAWAIIVAAFVVGVGSAIGGPSMQAVLPALVRPGELPMAVAFNAFPMTFARTAGPALGALLVVFGGSALPFALAAGSQFAFAAIMVFLPFEGAVPGRTAADISVRAGIRHLRRAPALRAALIGTLALGIGADPVITLTPSISRSLGGDAHLVGLLASSFGAGAALALPFVSRLRRSIGQERLGTLGLLLLTGGLALLAISPHTAMATAVLAVAGAGMTFALTVMMTTIYQQAPDGLRGRMMALWSIAFIGSRPLAAAVNGVVADATNASLALTLSAVVVGCCAWIARPVKLALRSNGFARPTTPDEA
jgi:MFS family permease